MASALPGSASMHTAKNLVAQIEAGTHKTESEDVHRGLGWMDWVHTTKSFEARTEQVVNQVVRVLAQSTKYGNEDHVIGLTSHRAMDKWVYLIVHVIDLRTKDFVLQIEVSNNDRDDLYHVTNTVTGEVSTYKDTRSLAASLGVNLPGRTARTTQPHKPVDLKAELAARLAKLVG